MKIIELGEKDNLKQSFRWYEGKGGKKLGIVYDGKNYLIKYPGNIKNRKENIEIDYNNAPISEYIGSHIYDMLGIDVHNTYLAKIKENGIEKVVVLCEDFLKNNERFISFNGLKISAFNKDVLDDLSNGTGCHLSSILKVLREDKFVSKIDGIEDRFFEMMVVDFFIGNPDRHNGNWGIIVDDKNSVRLAPVFDNGNCLYNLNSDKQLELLLAEKSFDYEFNMLRGSYLDDNNQYINVYDFICKSDELKLNKAIKNIVPKIDLKKISNLINEIIIISDKRKEFYYKVLEGRYYKCLVPLYER